MTTPSGSGLMRSLLASAHKRSATTGGAERHRDAGRMELSVVPIDQQPPTETAGVRIGAPRECGAELLPRAW